MQLVSQYNRRACSFENVEIYKYGLDSDLQTVPGHDILEKSNMVIIISNVKKTRPHPQQNKCYPEVNTPLHFTLNSVLSWGEHTSTTHPQFHVLLKWIHLYNPSSIVLSWSEYTSTTHPQFCVIHKWIHPYNPSSILIQKGYQVGV